MAVQIRIAPSKILGKNAYDIKEVGTAWEKLATQTGKLIEQYQAYQESEKELKIKNYQDTYKKGLAEFNADFMANVEENALDDEETANDYKRSIETYFDDYAKGIDLTLTKGERNKLQQEFATISQENFTKQIAPQLVKRSAERSKAVVAQTVQNTKDMASEGMIGIDHVKATYASNDLNVMGISQYGRKDWEVQKKILQSDALSGVYIKATNEFYKNFDEKNFNSLIQSIRRDKDLLKTDKASLLDTANTLKDRAIGSGLANYYLTNPKKTNLEQVNKHIEDRSGFNERQKEVAKSLIAKGLKDRTQQEEALQQQDINSAWDTVFATGSYLDVDLSVLNRLDKSMQDKLKNYQLVTKTNQAVNKQLLYKIMHGEKVDVASEGYKDLTLQDIQFLQAQQQQLADPVKQQQMAKVCDQIDMALSPIKEESKKAHVFSLIMEEVESRQNAQKQSITPIQLKDIMDKLVPAPTHS